MNIKKLLFFISIFVFSAISGLIFYYYKSINKNYNTELFKKEKVNIKNNNKNKNIENKNKEKKIVKINVKKEIEKKQNIIKLKRWLILLNLRKIPKLFFVVKFLNKTFLLYITKEKIFIIDFNNKYWNFIIKDNYKERINSIYSKDNIYYDKILNLYKVNDKNTIDDSLLNAFLSWFLAIDDYYIIDGIDIVSKLNLRQYRYNKLIGQIKTSFNVIKIIFINDIYNSKYDNNLLDLLYYLKNNNKILFVNFKKKELMYLYNILLKDINKIQHNKYEIYEIKLNNYYNSLLFFTLDKIIKKLPKTNNILIKTIEKYYIKQIKRKIKKITNSFIIYKYTSIVPLVKKPVIDPKIQKEVLDFIENLLVFK